MENAYAEYCSEMVEGELLYDTLFYLLDQFREAVDVWIKDYNADRAHSSPY